MSRARTILHLGAALLLSLAAGFLALQWMHGQARAKAMPAEVRPTASVAVAVAGLARGTRLEPAMLRAAPYFQESVPQGALSDPAAAGGRVLAQPLGPGEPLTADKLAPEGVTAGGMGAIVNPGRRAMAVKGNKVLGLNGFISPGNCVDVLVTVEDPRDKERKVSKIVLENVPVLATGGELDRKPGKEDLSSVEVYTLEVTPDEAERLSLAATHGTLHFALRNPADKATVLTGGVDIESTLAAFKEVPPAPPAAQAAKAAKAPPPRPTVQVIRGSTLDKVEF